MLKKNKKNMLISFVSLIFILMIIIIAYFNSKDDGMSQSGILNVYYKTYTSEKGWTKIVKNGLTSGDENNNIEKIYINTKTSKGEIVYSVYDENNMWVDSSEIKTMKSRKISGFRASLYDELYIKYNICYRTYNSKYKWMSWSCNNEINGAKSEYIKKVEIKIIPKKIVKYEYLKDYTMNTKSSNIGF